MITKTRLISILLMVVLCVSCVSTPNAVQEPEPVTYTPDSWRTMIPETCSHFFDGCNKCSRAPGAEMAACTRMACMEYKKPECLDAPK